MAAIQPLDTLDVRGRKVLLRLDINSPIDGETKRIRNRNRINMSLPTLNHLLEQGARVAIIAHQGDTEDYHNLIPLKEHASLLSAKTGRKIGYVDDVAGPAAQQAVRDLSDGEAVILGNLRYLTEEVSVFEKVVPLEPEEMKSVYHVRNLAPLFDFYVNDAFAAAHRKSPSMVAFQELLPSAAGFLFFNEVTALNKVMQHPDPPAVFVLGGVRINDAFGMMEQVLSTGKADSILTCGVTGNVFLLAKGIDIGAPSRKFLEERGLMEYVEPAARYLRDYPEQVEVPSDLAYPENGGRAEVSVTDLPIDVPFLDIGSGTIARYRDIIAKAGTVFVNGPAGVYEEEPFRPGTLELFRAVAEAPGYTVIGGGDSVTAAQTLIGTEKIDYVCTAGGAMVRYLSGRELPLIRAMQKAADR